MDGQDGLRNPHSCSGWNEMDNRRTFKQNSDSKCCGHRVRGDVWQLLLWWERVEMFLLLSEQALAFQSLAGA